MNIIRSSLVVGFFTLMSRLLGLVRDILTASVIGAGPAADAFFVALRFPNLFRRLFAEGAFAAAFVPLYAGRLEENGPEEADAFAKETFSFLLTFLLGLVVVFIVAMPLLMRILAIDFASDPSKFQMAVLWTQITTPYLFFIAATSLYGGVLNSRGRFIAAAGAPVLFNLVLILVLIQGWETPEQAGWALSWGVFASGVAQAAFILGAARLAGVKLGFTKPRLTPGVKRVIALGVPGAIAAGATQINAVVGQTLASMGGDGAISWLAYADRLYQLPLGLVGIAMGVALLPAMSRYVRAGETQQAEHAMNRGFEFALFLTLPAACALLAGADLIIEAIYQRGRFEATDTANTAKALAIYALGLPAFVIAKVLAPGFFARQDTKTPMRAALVSIGVNLVLGIVLFFQMGFLGLAWATTIAGWVNALWLGALLAMRGWWRPDGRLWLRGGLICLASLIMFAPLWGYMHLLPGLGGEPLDELFGGAVGATVVYVAMGAAIYAAAVLGLGAMKLSDLRSAMTRRSTPGAAGDSRVSQTDTLYSES